MVPLPASIETAEGNFIFGKKLTINTAGYAADSLQTVVNDFAETFEKATGVKVKATKSASARSTLTAFTGPLDSFMPYSP